MRPFLIGALVLLAGCAAAPDTPDPTPTAAGEPVCLGTVYPDGAVINPDDPVYSSETLPQDYVSEKFAEAKAADSKAYRAYLAAYEDGQEVLECAFCACGCAESDGHISAIDCFKDFHGFF